MSRRLTHHATIAQGNRRNHPVPPDIQCLITEGQISGSSSLDRTGNYVTVNNNIAYSSPSIKNYKGLGVLSFSGSEWVDIPLDMTSFQGAVEADFQLSGQPTNSTIWTNSNDGVGNFAYGVFVLSNRVIRIHNGGTYYDLNSNPINLNEWVNIKVVITDTIIRASSSTHGFSFTWNKSTPLPTLSIRLGQHSRVNAVGDYGLRGWIRQLRIS